MLEDGDDREALEKLIDYAVEREDHTEAATLLRRLGNIAVDKADKARVALREAELLAEGVGDVDMAIVRYESILSDLDPTCRPALQAVADLQEARENLAEAADALERELKLVADTVERGQIAARLARLYEQMDDPKSAIRALEIVRKSDLEDFDALTRLCELCERIEQWDRVAELLAQRIEVEADEAEASVMTKKLAGILAERLDRGDEALAALTELADQGDASIRAAYVELGDRLGGRGSSRRSSSSGGSRRSTGKSAPRSCGARSSASSRSGAIRTRRASRSRSCAPKGAIGTWRSGSRSSRSRRAITTRCRSRTSCSRAT